MDDAAWYALKLAIDESRAARAALRAFPEPPAGASADERTRHATDLRLALERAGAADQLAGQKFATAIERGIMLAPSFQ